MNIWENINECPLTGIQEIVQTTLNLVILLHQHGTLVLVVAKSRYVLLKSYMIT